MTRFSDRHILKYIGYGHDKPGARDTEVNGRSTFSAYIVTEYIEGKTLRDKVLEQVSHHLRRFVCNYRVAPPNDPLRAI